MKWRVALLQFIAVQDCYSLMGEIERGQGKVNGLWWVVVGRRQKEKQIPIDRSLLSFLNRLETTQWKINFPISLTYARGVVDDAGDNSNAVSLCYQCWQ